MFDRKQLRALWVTLNGDQWLADGHGNCLTPASEAFPDIPMSEPWPVFHVQLVPIGNERWLTVLCLGHVIVPPMERPGRWCQQ